MWCFPEYRGGKFCDCRHENKFSDVKIVEALNQKVYLELVSVYSYYLIDDHFHLEQFSYIHNWWSRSWFTDGTLLSTLDA